MKKKKLIDLHKEWMETGKLQNRRLSNTTGGLCSALPLRYKKHLDYLFGPSLDQIGEDMFMGYWAYNGISTNARFSAFTYSPLRQTIVLLICAMHNEI